MEHCFHLVVRGVGRHNQPCPVLPSNFAEKRIAEPASGSLNALPSACRLPHPQRTFNGRQSQFLGQLPHERGIGRCRFSLLTITEIMLSMGYHQSLPGSWRSHGKQLMEPPQQRHTVASARHRNHHRPCNVSVRPPSLCQLLKKRLGLTINCVIHRLLLLPRLLLEAILDVDKDLIGATGPSSSNFG